MFESKEQVFEKMNQHQKVCCFYALVSIWAAREKQNIDEESDWIAPTIFLMKFDKYNLPKDPGVDVRRSQLDSLSVDQKIWLVTEMHMIATYDGRKDHGALAAAIDLASEIGITARVYEQIIDVASSLSRILDTRDPLKLVETARGEYNKIVKTIDLHKEFERQEADRLLYGDDLDGDEWDNTYLTETDPIFDDLLPLFREDSIDIRIFTANFYKITGLFLTELDAVAGVQTASHSVEGATRMLVKASNCVSRFFCAAYPDVVRWFYEKYQLLDQNQNTREDSNWHGMMRQAFRGRQEFSGFECSKNRS